MKKQFVLHLLPWFFALWVAVGPPGLAQAQNEGLNLRISKVYGFNNFTNTQIQGTFSLQAKGPDNLVKVTFLIDGNSMGEATQSPFKITFNTASYSLGVHTLSAVGITSDSQELQSNNLQVNFLSPQASTTTMLKIIIPIFLIVGAAALISAIFPWLMRGGKNEELPLGAQRKYGVSGGAICPRCKRPYAMHALGLNLGIRTRLDRCPYCGKWAIVGRKSQDELRAAEVAELLQAQDAGGVPEESEEEKLRKEIDKSRYL
jgi:DNA-directed RNA polymerase subunit RPC12/RpoP